MRLGTPAATLLLLATVSYSALAQVPDTPLNNGARPGHQVGVGDSLPRSDKASNIGAMDTHSEVAPTLPAASVGEEGGVAGYLRAARVSLGAGRTGQAQQELEMAETRTLDRSVAAGRGMVPSNSALVARIHAAREDVGRGDSRGAIEMIDRALAG